MDHKDKQGSTLVVDTTQPTGLRGGVSNASGAEVRGLELERAPRHAGNVTLGYTFPLGERNSLFDDDTIRSGFTQGDFFGLTSSPGSRSYVVIATEPVRGGVRVAYRF